MGFVANVKADFKALPQRLRSGVMPKIIVGLNLGLCALMWVGVSMEADFSVSSDTVVAVLVTVVPCLVTAYLILSQRLKITLTVVLVLYFVWCSLAVVFDARIPPGKVVMYFCWLLWPIVNIIILWVWRNGNEDSTKYQ